MKSVPHRDPADKRANKRRLLHSRNGDIELATARLDTPRNSSRKQSADDSSHYGIAKNMKYYQSSDIGKHCEQ
jgi:hypothetical protein